MRAVLPESGFLYDGEFQKKGCNFKLRNHNKYRKYRKITEAIS